MSLGKSAVHARKQKSLAKCHALPHAEAVEPRVRFASAMQTPVLVLNASYEPINICGARRALVLVLKGVAQDRGGARRCSACGAGADADAVA